MSKKLLEPGLPRGFEDSFGKSLVIEKKIKEVIEKIFLRYGYTEIKTSPFEYSENIGGFLTDDFYTGLEPNIAVYAESWLKLGTAMSSEFKAEVVRIHEKNKAA